MESLKVYFLIANRMYGDGVRSGLGLSVENHYAFPVIMNGEFPPFTTYMSDNIAWVKDMEGQVYSCSAPAPDNCVDEEGDKLIAEISLEELGEALRDADFIIPYGLSKQTNEPPPSCSGA